ncbi:[FeFe] hydrogenase, group A [Salidesulfovibrio onnuriiensis]|uniref:[FeFe] hydrogenase, group A n=1 Tax=Salidesulfovibrio onnuriiensis TaxID=2583823 RepID=UPI0032B836AF
MAVNVASDMVKSALAERRDWLESKGNCRMIQQIQEFVACEAANSGLVDLDERLQWDMEGWASEPSIVHDPALCIRCGNCVTTCNEVQQVGALAMDEEKGVVMADPGKCVRCGQCIHACPMAKESDEVLAFKKLFGCSSCTYSKPIGAISEQDQVGEVMEMLRDPEQTVVVQFAPSIRASIGEEFGMEPGTLAVGKLYSALKQAGFDKVWDTNFTADLTIMEEGSELLLRLAKAGVLDRNALPVKVEDAVFDHVQPSLPQFTSCSPGWVKFCETFYPDLNGHVSSAKSPQQMFGAVAKTYAAKELNIDAGKMKVVSIMPCTAKKYECAREEMQDASHHWGGDGYQDVDVVLTTRECARLFKALNVDLPSMPDSEADPLIGKYTGAATIFGRTGGVMEAALRTAYELVTGQALEKLEFEPLGTLDGVKSATVEVAGIPVKVAVAHGLKNCREVCESIRNGGEFKDYQFIEFMCCPGGCIGGGGQPIATNIETIKARTDCLNDEDKNLPLRKSHENPEISKIYGEFLSSPVSPLAHHLLHTEYVDRSSDIKE